ncbi:Peptide hydrolase, partial [Tolypocladium paradoxum]
QLQPPRLRSGRREPALGPRDVCWTPPIAPVPMRMPLRSVFLPLLAALLALVSSASGLATLDDDDLRNIPSPGDDFDIRNGKLLAPILIPRVPGTEGSLKTQKHFVDFFKTNLPDWHLVWQNSTSKTPATDDRDVPFSNLIFQRDPPGAPPGDVSRLTLVAHYDSKLTPTGFIGATDSAAPCAMLLHVARSLEDALKAKWAAGGDALDGLEGAEGVQIVLLDGEEAFVQWTDDDSLYGARSLAAEWEAQYYPSMSTYRTPLHSISLFVLLDLLGVANPSIPSYFLTTHWAYKNMAAIEKRMRELGVLESRPTSPFLPEPGKESSQFTGGPVIGDDHVPFMRRGVDILHIIPSHFPDVWHNMDDDGDHLDLPTVRDWAKIVTAFAAEWLDLKGHIPRMAATREKRSETTAATSRRTEL